MTRLVIYGICAEYTQYHIAAIYPGVISNIKIQIQFVGNRLVPLLH